MAVTDQDQLSEVQLTVLEVADSGVTWNSELWTATEVLNYYIQRQNRFLRDTLLFTDNEQLAVTAGTKRVALPAEWIASLGMAWQDLATGVWTPMHKSDSYEADRGMPNWEASGGTPSLYMDADAAALETQIGPVPSADGLIDLLFTGLAAVLTGAGEIFTVPDEYVPYITSGVLADMFGKIGRAHDGARSAYCEARFAEGVQLGKLYMEGWS